MDSSKHADIELQIPSQESTSRNQVADPIASSTFPEPPEPAAIPRQTWKLFSAAFSFFVAGVNDGSMGALLPYMLKEYHVDTSFIAIL
jgi:hypothetical protein